MPVVLTVVYARGIILREHQDAPVAVVRISGKSIHRVDSLLAVLSRETLRHVLNVLIGQDVRE